MTFEQCNSDSGYSVPMAKKQGAGQYSALSASCLATLGLATLGLATPGRASLGICVIWSMVWVLAAG